MCDIGKPLEILDVEPLVRPASLRRETEQPATIEFLVTETETKVEPVTVEKL